MLRYSPNHGTLRLPNDDDDVDDPDTTDSEKIDRNQYYDIRGTKRTAAS